MMGQGFLIFLFKDDLDELRNLGFQEKKKDKEIRDKINNDFQNLN